MRVFAVQFEPVELDPEANLKRAAGFLAQAAAEQADLVVMPETWSTGYDLPAARQLADRSASLIPRLAEEVRKRSVAMVGSMVLPSESGVSNAALLLDKNGEVALRYAKSHLIDAYREKEIFEAGRDLPTVEIAGARMGVAICYDLRFPELFRSLVDQGAEVLVVVAEWPEVRIGHWEVLLQARAIENQAWVIGVNRVGADRATTYGGRSRIVDPAGCIVAEAPENAEAQLVVDLDLDALRARRRDFPVLTDRWIGVPAGVNR
jgi:omega-amidase